MSNIGESFYCSFSYFIFDNLGTKSLLFIRVLFINHKNVKEKINPPNPNKIAIPSVLKILKPTK